MNYLGCMNNGLKSKFIHSSKLMVLGALLMCILKEKELKYDE
jgi:hypothetical protein